MKKIFISLLAVAALAACTKSEVAYEASAEIGFAPAVKNVTKAAETGTLNSDNQLGIWAFWNGVNGSAPQASATYANYTDAYLADALFINRTTTNDGTTTPTANWGGQTSYPWPTNGALVFAGYNKLAGAGFSASYSFIDNAKTTNVNEENTMTFTNYTQSTNLATTFDLCWFGRTASSYNNRTNGNAVSVTMSHALTWITINIKGDATTAPTGDGAKPWKVTKATLLNVNTQGTGTCVFDAESKASATWTSANPQNMILKSAEQPLLTTAASYESVTDGVVVTPQTPVMLEVEYTYPVGDTYKPGKTTVNLTLDGTKKEDGTTANTKIEKWLSGTHYIYTIVFKANEILVAPSYGEWATSDQSVTVE